MNSMNMRNSIARFALWCWCLLALCKSFAWATPPADAAGNDNTAPPAASPGAVPANDNAAAPPAVLAEPPRPATPPSPPPIKGEPPAKRATRPDIPADAPESYFIDKIKPFVDAGDDDARSAERSARSELVPYVDEFLRRFPTSEFREEALIVKLAALADLARLHPAFLDELLLLTEQIGDAKPGPRLAAENAYFAIQAFVLAARAEGMPDDRIRKGAIERYLGFVEDHRSSARVPVVTASAIRHLLADGQRDKAIELFNRLQSTHPSHRATRRAQGEIRRYDAVGKPFSLAFETTDGRQVRTADYLGKVVLVHFWATWSEQSMKELPRLSELHREFGAAGLQLVGINIDRARGAFEEAVKSRGISWPQYFDARGLENVVLVDTGVLQIPEYFLLDRRGVLQSIGGGDGMRAAITKLLKNPATPGDSTTPAASPPGNAP